MPSVTCPSCGEKGKIGPNLIGARIKCKKCGISFLVAAPVAKAVATAGSPGPTAVAGSPHGIEVEGLDASSWSLSTETGPARPSARRHDRSGQSRHEVASGFAAVGSPAAGLREYKLLTPKDKYFDGKFELNRLEDALNHYGRQGWVVKAMSTPHIKGFSGGPEETIVVLLERSSG